MPEWRRVWSAVAACLLAVVPWQALDAQDFSALTAACVGPVDDGVEVSCRDVYKDRRAFIRVGIASGTRSPIGK